jgi:hypothetical protein
VDVADYAARRPHIIATLAPLVRKTSDRKEASFGAVKRTALASRNTFKMSLRCSSSLLLVFSCVLVFSKHVLVLRAAATTLKSTQEANSATFHSRGTKTRKSQKRAADLHKG